MTLFPRIGRLTRRRRLAIVAVVAAFTIALPVAWSMADPANVASGESGSGAVDFVSEDQDLWPGNDLRAAGELPVGDEPIYPFAQPDDPPQRGCATVADPVDPPADSPPAIQVLYAYHQGNGSRYEESAEVLAKVVDRIDWSLDASSDYDQHLNLSCAHADDGSYADYAKAMIEPVEITSGTPEYTSSADVRNDLHAAGYTDTNRFYLVFTDFDSESDSYLCPETGGKNCNAVVELWDSGVAGHELGHLLGAGHAWMTQKGESYVPDIMYGWWDYWIFDTGFNTYYDPSQLDAAFYFDPSPSTGKANIAAHPALSAPVAGDGGPHGDLLTAQERTIEADAPGNPATGFEKVGDSYLQVTAACGTSGQSCYFFDGRRALSVAGTEAESGVSLERAPEITAGDKYKFFVRLRGDQAGNVVMRMDWLDSAGTTIATSESDSIAIKADWAEKRLTADAPADAVAVKLSVVAPDGQTKFTFVVDSLQLNPCEADQCRFDT